MKKLTKSQKISNLLLTKYALANEIAKLRRLQYDAEKQLKELTLLHAKKLTR